MIVADPESVSDEELQRFDYIAFKENVAIGVALAKLLGIPHDLAMKGMVDAAPDPGVLRMKELEIGGKRVTWANLFAVNDRESMTVAMEKLVPFMTEETITVGILNNRSDRERRAIQFADVAVNDLDFDRLVTFGAYESLVTSRLVENGYPAAQILNLGDTHSPPVEEIVDKMIVQQPAPHILVVGFVNIHTHQAEMMLEYFEHEAAPWGLETAAPGPSPRSSDARLSVPHRCRPARVPRGRRRLDLPLREEPPDDRLDRRPRVHRALPGAAVRDRRRRSQTRFSPGGSSIASCRAGSCSTVARSSPCSL